jgi:type VI secretion system secreted protein Hcp
MAASDFFLKIDGIEGESTDAKHKGEIDLLGWNWSETNAGSSATGGGGGAGRVRMQDLTFEAYMNKATPKLMLACASGQHIKKAVLTCRKAGGDQQEFFIITMSDLLVSSYQNAGSSASITGTSGSNDTEHKMIAHDGDLVPGGNLPMDRVTLNFAKIEFEYKEQKADGTLNAAVKAGWDLKANRKV